MPEKPEAADRLAVTGEHITAVPRTLANGKSRESSKL
jgi:hypothetical protein